RSAGPQGGLWPRAARARRRAAGGAAAVRGRHRRGGPRPRGPRAEPAGEPLPARVRADAALNTLVRKTAGSLVAALGAVLLVSVFLDLVPGDPVDAILGEQAREADRAELRRALHLDEPLALRLVRFARDAAT